MTRTDLMGSKVYGDVMFGVDFLFSGNEVQVSWEPSKA